MSGKFVTNKALATHLDAVTRLIEAQASCLMDSFRARTAWQHVLASVPAECLVDVLAIAFSSQRHQTASRRRC